MPRKKKPARTPGRKPARAPAAKPKKKALSRCTAARENSILDLTDQRRKKKLVREGRRLESVPEYLLGQAVRNAHDDGMVPAVEMVDGVHLPDRYDRVEHREMMFVDALISNGFNARKAARVVCPELDGASCSKYAYTELKKDSVQDMIKERLRILLGTSFVYAERVLKELSVLAFSDMNDYDLSNISESDIIALKEDAPAESSRAISGVDITHHYDRDGQLVRTTKRIKLWNKLQALDMLKQILAMAVERKEVSFPDGAPTVQVGVITDQMAKDYVDKVLGVAQQQKQINGDVVDAPPLNDETTSDETSTSVPTTLDR